MTPTKMNSAFENQKPRNDNARFPSYTNNMTTRGNGGFADKFQTPEIEYFANSEDRHRWGFDMNVGERRCAMPEGVAAKTSLVKNREP